MIINIEEYEELESARTVTELFPLTATMSDVLHKIAKKVEDSTNNNNRHNDWDEKKLSFIALCMYLSIGLALGKGTFTSLSRERNSSGFITGASSLFANCHLTHSTHMYIYIYHT